jgi:hypothetical protein
MAKRTRGTANAFFASALASTRHNPLPDLLSDPPMLGLTCVIAYDKAARPVLIRYKTVHGTVPFLA